MPHFCFVGLFELTILVAKTMHGLIWLSYAGKIPTQQELDSGTFIDSKKRFLLAHTWFNQLTISVRCAGAEMPLNRILPYLCSHLHSHYLKSP